MDKIRKERFGYTLDDYTDQSQTRFETVEHTPLTWEGLEHSLNLLGFRRASYTSNALHGNPEISSMSFKRGDLYLNVNREGDGKYQVETYNPKTNESKEDTGLDRNDAWIIAERLAKES